MIPVQQVFDTAIHLMDEQNEMTGSTATTDTQEYAFRTLSILNTILPSLYPYSDTCVYPSSGRPVCPMLQLPKDPAKPDLSQSVPLDDALCLGVLPYALAEHLLAGENEALSAWFSNRYAHALTELRNKIPGTFEPIPTPYGLF